MDVYEKITNEFISIIESTGKLPWQRGWSGEGIDFAVSYSTGKPYNFLNQCLLGFKGGEWLTFNQVQSLGGRVKKGAKASVVYGTAKKTKTETNEDGEEITKTFWVYRYYSVFNVNDCEGIKPKHTIEPAVREEFVANEIADGIIADYVERTGVRFISKKMMMGFECPHYSPSLDEVVVPLKEQFDNPSAYYSTTFHELVHSTLKEDRCNRKSENELSRFGNEQYSKEELVAELGSAIILSKLGMSTESEKMNQAAYLKSWLSALKNDSKMLIQASSKAEKASKFILNEKTEEVAVAA